LYRRVCDVWNKPIATVPGAVVDVIDRKTDDYNWTFKYDSRDKIGTTIFEIFV
jgi:serine palmitoyltransferase